MGNIFNKTEAQQQFVSKTAFYDGNDNPLFIEKTQMKNGTDLYTYTGDVVKGILVSKGVTNSEGIPLFQTKEDVETLLKKYEIIDNDSNPLFATLSEYNTLNSTVLGKLNNQLSYDYTFQTLKLTNGWSIQTNPTLLCVNKGNQQVVCINGSGEVDYNSINMPAPSKQFSTSYDGFLPTSTTTVAPGGYIRFKSL